MTPDQWAQIRNFNPEENWGDPTKMDFALLQELDAFRGFIGTEIHVNCGVQGEHVNNSMHYHGKAVDIMFPSVTKEDLFDLWIAAQRFPEFRGVGLYPDWNLDGRVLGGMHLDSRPGNRALWLGKRSEGGNSYLPLTLVNLKTLGLV